MKKETIIIIMVPTILVLLIASVSFYWFALRPSQIKQTCSKQAKGGQHDEWYWNNYGKNEFDNNYTTCVREKGL